MSAALAAITPQYDISIEDRLCYRNVDWAMRARRGSILDFLDGRSGELLSISDEDLAGLIASRQARIERGVVSEKDRGYAAATADLFGFRSADLGDARRSIAYVDEELRAQGLTHRLSASKVEAAITRVAARIADPEPPQVYLVKRWMKRGIERAAAGGRDADAITVGDLVPQHGFKGNHGRGRPCFEVTQIIHERINAVYLTREQRSVETLIAAVRTKVRAANENRGPDDQLILPGRKAVQAAIDSLPRDTVLTARFGADEAYAQVGPVEYRERPEAPLDEVEVDHTTCDLFIVDGLTGAPLGRPIIALGADRCTAMPWAVHVGFDPPSVHTMMQLIRNGVYPKNYVQLYAGAGVWDIEGSWPVFGRPRQISVDRGAENLNHDLKALGADLPVKVIEAKAGRSGRLKGQVERMLGTLNRTVLQEQRGTTFSNVVDRDDYDPKKNAVITYEELQEKIHQFLIDVYMRRKHHGIRDVPLRLWNEKILQHRPPQVENADKLLPLFGRVEHRTLRRDGIKWKHNFYTSPELMVLLSDDEFLKASKNGRGDVIVRFRYDPTNIDHIHVYLPHACGRDTMHLHVRIEKRRQQYARGLSVWAHDAIVKMANETTQGNVDHAAIDLARSKLLGDLEAQTPGSAKVRGTMRIARIRQIGGVAPFGDSVRTTPEGSFEDQRQETAVAAAAGKSHSSLPNAANDGLPLPSESESFEDYAAGDSDMDSGEPPVKGRKVKYARGSDPAVSGKRVGGPRPGGRPRKIIPKVTVPKGKVEIDVYSDEVMA